MNITARKSALRHSAMAKQYARLHRPRRANLRQLALAFPRPACLSPVIIIVTAPKQQLAG
jgi:hypothetical protein